MLIEDKLREMTRNECLYEDDRIKISRSPVEIDGHDLIIGNNPYPYFLARGILKDWAGMQPEQFKQSLLAYDRRILECLEQAQIPIETIGWALAKAKIRSLEDELFGAR